MRVFVLGIYLTGAQPSRQRMRMRAMEGGEKGGRKRRQAGRQAGRQGQTERRESGREGARKAGWKKNTNHFAHEEGRRARDFGEQDAEDVAAGEVCVLGQECVEGKLALPKQQVWLHTPNHTSTHTSTQAHTRARTHTHIHTHVHTSMSETVMV